MIKKTNRRLLIGIIIALAGICLAGTGYYYFSTLRPCEGISLYNAKRDREKMVCLFKENWYWLLGDAEKNSRPEDSSFSIEHYLENERQKDETVAVYCIDGKPIGLVSYYSESFCKGKLHFIVIDPLYRGRGYAEKLMQYALENMKKKGLSIVQLITRTDNIPAQKLYAKLGFKEFWRDDRFVKFEKELS